MTQHMQPALLTSPLAAPAVHKEVLPFPHCAPLRDVADLAGRISSGNIWCEDVWELTRGWEALRSMASVLRGSADSLTDAPCRPGGDPEPGLRSLLLPDLSHLLRPDGMPNLDAGTTTWRQMVVHCWTEIEEAAMEVLFPSLPPAGTPDSVALAIDQDARARLSRAEAWLDVWTAREDAEQAAYQAAWEHETRGER